MIASWALHTAAPDPSLVVVLVLAGLGTALLLGLGLAALLRRRSRSYLLVALALATLFARSVVAGLSLAAWLPAGTHHLVEHALDVVMAGLVIAAVYYARSVERPAVDHAGHDGVEDDD
jgi:hypothetical protein